MLETAMLVIAPVCGVGGLIVGYILGHRNGCVVGELRALHSSLSERRSRHEHRHRRRHRDPDDSPSEDEE